MSNPMGGGFGPPGGGGGGFGPPPGGGGFPPGGGGFGTHPPGGAPPPGGGGFGSPPGGGGFGASPGGGGLGPPPGGRPTPAPVATGPALVLALVTVIMCGCVPGGVIGLLFAHQAKQAADKGDAATAKSKLMISYLASGLSIALMGVGLVLYVALLIIAG